MSKITIIGGDLIENIGGSYKIYADEGIEISSNKEVIFNAKDGIKHGSPQMIEIENEPIVNCLVNFLPCDDYMELSKPERKGETEPDSSKIYGFDAMKKKYEDTYGYFWNSKLNEDRKPIIEKNTSAFFSNLEKEYNPSIITWKKKNNKYYVPWLSIYNGQTIRLNIEMDWDNQPKKLEWDTAFSHKDKLTLPEISTIKIQKKSQEIKISCISNFTEEIEVRILADGLIAGKLKIVPNKQRKLKITWCLVDLSGKNKKDKYIDIEALKDKLSQQKINRFVKYLGLSQALINVEATSTYKELHLSDLGYTWDKYIAMEGYKYSGNSIIKEKRASLRRDCQKEFEKLYPDDDNHIVMFLVNKQAPETTTNKTEKTITENPLYQVRGSAFDLGSKYLILYKGFEEYPKIVVHEILHCLELRHSFDDDAKHMFKPYETENFMDYVYGEENDNRKQLWKWQWQIIWNYIDNQH